MKRLTTVVVLLFCFALGTLICTAVSLQEDVRDVRLTEVTHQGDISAADGLTVVSQNHWDYHAFWTTTHRLGHAEEAEAAFDFTAGKRYGGGNTHIDFLMMQSELPLGIDFTEALEKVGLTLGEVSSRNFDITTDAGTFREFATSRSLGLPAAYNELYMDAPLNQEVSRIVRVSDYYDYYPISVSINLPGVIWTNNDVSPTMIAEPGTEAYVVQYFRDYFKIPMREEETVEIHLTRRSNGLDGGMSWGSSDNGSDSYSFYTLSAADDRYCYFTFNTRTMREGAIVDTSEIKGGYGIYRLPYRNGTSTADIGVDVDAMEMVYPLEPGTEIEALYFNAAKTRLLLVTKADDQTLQIDIIDSGTYECLQTFSMGGSFFSNLKIYEDYTVAVSSDRLMVLTEENSIYTHAFTVMTVIDEDGNPELIHSQYVTAFDGTRLAVACNAYTPYYRGRDLCGYDVTVYSADGILWDGTVETSLDKGIRRNSYSSFDLVPYYSEQLSLAWE